MLICIQFYLLHKIEWSCSIFYYIQIKSNQIEKILNLKQRMSAAGLVERIIVLNFHNYTSYDHGDDLKVTPIIHSIPLDVVLYNVSLRKSTIHQIIIDGKINPSISFKELMFSLYRKIDVNTLLQHTTLNISVDIYNEMGFHYYEELGISVQEPDELRMVYEIFEWIKRQNQTLELFVKLRKGDIIKIVS